MQSTGNSGHSPQSQQSESRGWSLLFQRLTSHPVYLGLSAAGLAATLISFVLALAGAPVWATGPSVGVVSSDTRQPFAAFTATNRSLIFQTRILATRCNFDRVEIRGGVVFSDLTVGAAYGDGVIPPQDSRPFYCGVNAPLGMASLVKVRIEMVWITPFAGVRNHAYQSPPFTWKDGQWSVGNPLH